MTKSEFQKKVIQLLKKYQLNRSMKEKIIPLFSLVDSLTQEEMVNVYNLLEEAVVAQKEAERLSDQLNALFNDFNNTVRDVSKRLDHIKTKLKGIDQRSNERMGLPVYNKNRIGNTMKYNKQSFPGGKPNFGLKLNKLFAAFITEYGPKYITIVISDSILYTNNLILRISLNTKEVLIGSSKSLKLYDSSNGHSFLITDKPEVIPYGSKNGFYFKNITYEDILSLTNGDYFKVFNTNILNTFKPHEVALPEELKTVGYFKFD
jgi:hypothetical protein